MSTPGSQEIIDHSMDLIIIVLIKFIADMIFIKVWSSLGEFFYYLSWLLQAVFRVKLHPPHRQIFVLKAVHCTSWGGGDDAEMSGQVKDFIVMKNKADRIGKILKERIVKRLDFSQPDLRRGWLSQAAMTGENPGQELMPVADP